MAKNVILIINDSMRYEAIGDNPIRWGKSATPFIDSIKNECLVANNMYSQGPYTEAAMKSLLTGRDLLDNGGYLYRFYNAPATIFEPFHDYGYETFYTCLPDFLFSKQTKKSIDHCWYAEMPMFADFFTFRLDAYYQKIKTENLAEKDFETLSQLFKLHFDLFIDFFEEFTKNPNDERYYFVKNRLKCYSVETIISVWKNAQQEFLKNKKNYIVKTLQQEREAPIYKVASDLWALENKDAPLAELYDENKVFFDKCVKIQKNKNLLNGKNNFKLLHHFIKAVFEKIFRITDDKCWIKGNYFKNWRSCYKDNTWNNLLRKHKPYSFEVWPSMKSQIDLFFQKIDERQNSNRPFFFVMHTLNAHYVTAMLSYDSSNKETLQKEINILKLDLENISKDFCGYLSYRQAIRYVDYYTEYLFDGLKKRNLIDNTIVAMTSDHGSSFGPSLIREEPRVNNQHIENYHIPFIVYNKEFHKEIDRMSTSKDMATTLFDMADVPYSNNFTGVSLVQENLPSCDIARSEYMGPGNPDMRIKPVRFIIRNRKYSLAYYVKLSEPFENGELISIYDIENDKDELHDIKNKINMSEVKDLFEDIHLRFDELRKENNIQ